MAKAKVNTLDGLPEGLAAEYEERDGQEGYFLKVDPVDGLELGDIAGMRKALQEERGNRKALEKFGDITPEQARRDRDRVQELEAKIEGNAVSKTDELEAAKAESRRLFEEAKQKWDQERASMESIMDAEFRHAAGLQLLRDNGFSSAAELMVHELLPNLRLKRGEDGMLTKELEVVDAKGTVMVGPTPGTDMSPVEFVKGLHRDERLARWADGTSHSGGGERAGNGTERVGGAAPKQLSGLNSPDDLEAIAAGTAVRA